MVVVIYIRKNNGLEKKGKKLHIYIDLNQSDRQETCKVVDNVEKGFTLIKYWKVKNSVY